MNTLPFSILQKIESIFTKLIEMSYFHIQCIIEIILNDDANDEKSRVILPVSIIVDAFIAPIFFLVLTYNLSAEIGNAKKIQDSLIWEHEFQRNSN